MTEEKSAQFSDREALLFHSEGRPGKIEIVASKPMATQRDLALAYSPGVAVPVQAIADDPATAYDYTTKGNLVAVISNGTAILGMGNLGALASKPVMEGKAVLFKRFADVDSIDLEVKTEDVQRFIECVELLEPSFGGINLEDIKAPECFIIEQTLRERMNIPVFHDDQHGTAIITAAGLINACLLTGRQLGDVKVAVNGAGAAAIACTELIKAMGVRGDNVIMCDRTGVIYQGRTEGMDQWKSAHAVKTDKRTLKEALVGADVFLGLSAAGAVTPDMVKDMAPAPIIFAMANPEPEIRPEAAKAARPDAIIATGRSDYPNQVNNVLGFPFIFRGALDVRATGINEEMKIAAANAIAELAREQVPEEVAAAYGVRHSFGPEYIIPAPFDPRLMEVVPAAVAKAAMDSGVATKPILDMAAYRQQLRGRLNPTTSVLTLAYEGARAQPKRVLFAEGEEEVVLRAAVAFKEGGYGTPVLVGRDDVHDRLRALGVKDVESYEVHNSRNSPLVPKMVEFPLQAPPAPRLSPSRRRADDQPGPQHLRRGDAPARRGRRDDHRRHAHLCPHDARSAPRDRCRAGPHRVRHPRHGRAEPHRVPGRHDDQRASQRRGTRRHRRTDRGGGAADGPRAARRVPQLLDLRQSRGTMARKYPRRGRGARPAPGELRI